VAGSDAELAVEQAHVDRAYARLDELRKEAEETLRAVLVTSRGGTPQARAERDIVVRTTLARLDQLDVGDQALCFGRIDRRADHGPLESFHLGRVAVADENMEPLVVDWRAPVAEPFYRATGLDPMGLVLRRHLAADGRRIVGMEDERFDTTSPPSPEVRNAAQQGHSEEEGPLSPESIELGGPGALLASLAGVRSDRMRDIVATIQREQDEIIRSPLGGVLVVQGGPGTGKTAVALHRAAYLLYTHRFPLERQGVLVVGPNPVFLRYISHVLPSLGETGVTLSTIGGLVHGVEAGRSDPAALARLKGDARMSTFLARAVRSRERPLRSDLLVPYGTAYLRLGADESKAIIAAARRRPGAHNAKRHFVVSLVVARLREDWKRRKFRAAVRGSTHSDEVADAETDRTELGGSQEPERTRLDQVAGADTDRTELEEISELDMATFSRAIRRTREFREALARMWPVLSAEELLGDLFSHRPLLAEAGRGVLSQAEQDLLWSAGPEDRSRPTWSEADLALIDEARVLLGPVPPRKRAGALVDTPGLERGLETLPDQHEEQGPVRQYGHIVVDEAQSLSPMQLRMIARRSLSGSITMVGDMAQATGPRFSDSWDDVVSCLWPGRSYRMVELTVSYRTPAEVLDVAARVLGEIDPTAKAPRAARRSGVAPRVVEAPPRRLGEVVVSEATALSAALFPGTVAVIVPSTLKQAVGASFEMAGEEAPDLAAGGLGAPVGILSVEEASGLEFDGSVVVEPAEMSVSGPSGLRALYVALTRPTKALVVVHELPLPGFLEAGVGTRGTGSASK